MKYILLIISIGFGCINAEESYNFTEKKSSIIVYTFGVESLDSLIVYSFYNNGNIKSTETFISNDDNTMLIKIHKPDLKKN